MQAGLTLRGLYLPQAAGSGGDLPSLSSGAASTIAQAAERGRLYRLTPTVLKKIAYGQSPRGVVAEFDQPDRSLDQLRLPETPLVFILDQIEKPGNLGAVFRCADGAGVDAVILCDGSGDLFNPNSIRSSLGTVFSLPAAAGSYDAVQQFLLSHGLRVLAARVESATPLWATDFRGALAVVLGSESEGLGTRWKAIGDTPVEGVRIPMQGTADSLNLSVSAAVIAYEAVHRRRGSDDGCD